VRVVWPSTVTAADRYMGRHAVVSVLAAISPDEPGLDGFIGAKDDGVGCNNWRHKSYKAPVKLSPPTNQHPMFYMPNALHISLFATTSVGPYVSMIK